MPVNGSDYIIITSSIVAIPSLAVKDGVVATRFHANQQSYELLHVADSQRDRGAFHTGNRENFLAHHIQRRFACANSSQLDFMR